MKCVPLFGLLLLLLVVPAGVTRAETAARSAEEALQRKLQLMHCSNGVYTLLEAAAAGNAEVVRERLARGANPNKVDELGNRPLHYAAQGKSVAVVRLLLLAGADRKAKNARGRIPADLCRTPQIRKILGASDERRCRELDVDEMAMKGDAEGVRRALRGLVNPNARSADGKGSLLQTAVKAGHAEVVQVLLEAGARPDELVEKSGCSALHLAAQAGHTQMIAPLLAARANPLLRAGNGATALHDAVWHNQVETLYALLPAYSGVNFNPAGSPQGFPVHMAISRKANDCVRAFLMAGMNPDDECFGDQPPLVFAARCGNVECVKMLLEFGADRNARDASGKRAADYVPASQIPGL